MVCRYFLCGRSRSPAATHRAGDRDRLGYRGVRNARERHPHPYSRLLSAGRTLLGQVPTAGRAAEEREPPQTEGAMLAGESTSEGAAATERLSPQNGTHACTPK